MRGVRRCLAGLVLLAQAAAASHLAGESIYQDGLRVSGEPVRAVVQRHVILEGVDAACVNCHRRSGLGGSEGKSPVRPIAGRLLFTSSQTELARRWGVEGGSAAHPAYTRASLGRALRDGVDPNGRTLDALMPRYLLSDAEVDQIYAYLAGLSSTAAPGVSDRELHLATIIAPDAEPEKRRAMLDVLQAFFREKNGGTRLEARRREAGSEQMYLAYRTWVLHVWMLDGPPQTWRAQLETYYRRQPVFAVIGGLGGGSWQPVHGFCEDFALPCVFPDVDYPVVAGAGYYSVYFSRGVALEADVLAKRLAEAPAGPGRIVQVFRDGEGGRMAAQALRDALQRRRVGSLADRAVSRDEAADAGFWTALLHDARPDTVVAWLDPADVRGLAAAGDPPPGLEAVYVSASLSSSRPPALPAPWLARLHMVYPFGLPERRQQHLARMTAWLRTRHIAPGDVRSQANAFFAASIVGDALAHIGDNFSRDYFIERIEQMAETSLSPSIYPHLSLGPGQRFASRGGYIVGFPQGTDAMPVALSDWLVP